MDEIVQMFVCRVCLIDSAQNKKQNNFFSLFDNYRDGIIKDKLNTITKIEIMKEDGFPEYICSDCLLDLENALSFKEKCENSDLILRSAIVETNQLCTEMSIKTEPDDNISMDEYYVDCPLQFSDEIKSNLLVCQSDENPGKKSHSGNVKSEKKYRSKEVKTDKKKNSQDVKTEKKSRALDLKLECHDCGGIFKSKCKLGVHWKKVHLYEKLKCLKCKRQFKTYLSYNRHVKGDNKSCNVIAANVDVEEVGKSRIFHCKSCKYSTKRIKDLTAHVFSHTGERPFTCNICNRSFTQYSSLDAHKESAHKIYKLESTCQFCGKHIKGRVKLYRHIKIHTNTQIKCKICNKHLKGEKSFKVHMVRHSGVKSYSCDKCPDTFFTCAELCTHRRTRHTVQSFKCDLCDYVATRKKTIKMHSARHTNTNIPCLICGAFLDSKEEFEAHQRRHIDRPFSCPHCETTFHSRKSISTHIRKKHRMSYAKKRPDQEYVSSGATENKGFLGNGTSESVIILNNVSADSKPSIKIETIIAN